MTAQTTFGSVTRSTLLQRALQGNAIFSGVSGLALTLDANPIARLLGVNAPAILMGIGVGLLLYAVMLFREAGQTPINRTFALTAVIADVAWVIGSAILLATNWVPFTITSWWIVAIVADVVALFAILQYVGLRRLS